METEQDEIITPTPAGLQDQHITEKNTSQADDLSSWLDDFVSTPIQSAQPLPRPIAPPPPPMFDALVMFVKATFCECGSCYKTPTYTGLRKPVKNGFNYLEYIPVLAESAKNLPRFIIETIEHAPFCQSCFQGETIPDDAPRAQFHPSRQTTVDDLRLFASRNVLPLPGEADKPTARYNPDGRDPFRSFDPT